MEKNINTATLENIEINELMKSWNKAFSDYAVKLEMTEDILSTLIRQNFVRFDASIGAFDGENLVGFWLNGMREIGGSLTAYDSGTAIWPEYRKMGISKMLSDKSVEVLKSLGCKEYILEVISDNKRAYEIYLKTGFQVTRKFLCLETNSAIFADTLLQSDFTLKASVLDDKYRSVASLMEYAPSWQNSADAVLAIRDKMHYVTAHKNDEIVGYGIIQLNRGRIPQIGVRKDLWESDLPSVILKELCSKMPVGSEIAIINIDEKADKTINLLTKHNFKISISQFEMKKAI